MKNILFTSVLLLFVSLINAQRAATFLTDSLDNYIRTNLAKWELPGLSLAVVKDGEIVHLNGYGIRSIETKGEVDENTKFQIASITKSFTATTLAILQEEKKINLNDKVIEWLPYFKIKDSLLTKRVDIEDLLSHRIGFGDHQGDLSFGRPPKTRREVVQSMAILDLAKKFRASYGYSNKAFVAAGEIINRVTDKSWEEVVQEKIFTPLKMNSTKPHYQVNQNYTNIAYPHTNFKGKLVQTDFVPMKIVAPAGAIVSSAKDMANWLKVQLAEGKLGDEEVIPRRAIRMTRRVNSVLGLNQTKDARTQLYAYGLGYAIRDVEGYLTFQHSGGGYGFSTNHVIVPEKDFAFIILTNDDVTDFYMDLTNVILDVFLDLPFVDYSSKSLVDYNEEKLKNIQLQDSINKIVDKGLKPSIPLKSFTGSYFNESVGELSIVYENNRIKMLLPEYLNINGTMDYLGDNKFLCSFSNYDYGTVEIPFKIKESNIEGLTLNITNFEDTDYYFKKIQ